MSRDEAKFLTKGDNNNADDTTLFGKGYACSPNSPHTLTRTGR
jgi:hypothetical protein